jgi:putative chitinase
MIISRTVYLASAQLVNKYTYYFKEAAMPFEFNFTKEKLQECLPLNKQIDEWFPIVYAQLEYFQINTVQRVAGFLAQCAHESLDFTVTHENLNYKAEALTKIFHKYFPDIDHANAYAKQPEKIANKIYANRMGNGDEASGDGYRFRGRGIVQLTGHDNYKNCSLAIFNDDRLLHSPDWLETKEGCVVGACWFWNVNNINSTCDADDIVAMSKKVNGGTIGLEDRTKKYNDFCDILAE